MSINHLYTLVLYGQKLRVGVWNILAPDPFRTDSE